MCGRIMVCTYGDDPVHTSKYGVPVCKCTPGRRMLAVAMPGVCAVDDVMYAWSGRG